jgi:hypothetical protein
MKMPKGRGAAVDDARIAGWVDHFRFYRAPPDRNAINAWMSLFRHRDRDVAARILDCIDVVSEQSIQRGYKQALALIPGWSKEANARKGRWLFVGFGGAGESGQSMVRIFREANKLSFAKYDGLFCTVLELASNQLTAEDTVVFIDDFSGSGGQVCAKWPVLAELIGAYAQTYLILTAVTEEGLARITEETSLKVIATIEISKAENIFRANNPRFNQNEQTTLLRYCRKADNKNPKGYGQCGLLYVLSHKTPNNSIPILHANHSRWKGLFPRYLEV